jgi:plastocyanin
MWCVVLMMTFTRQDVAFKALSTSMIFVLLVVSFVGTSTFETFAQGTNATNATSAANATSTGGAGGETVTVVMPLGSSAATSGAGYEPPNATVSPGGSVIWDNQDNALHTATSGESPTPDGKFDTGLLGANLASEPIAMPAEPGEYTYYCTLHPFLVGTVTVQ